MTDGSSTAMGIVTSTPSMRKPSAMPSGMGAQPTADSTMASAMARSDGVTESDSHSSASRDRAALRRSRRPSRSSRCGPPSPEPASLNFCAPW
jgi:hypothetical protein